MQIAKNVAKHILAGVFFFFCAVSIGDVPSVNAATNVSGTLVGNVTWIKANSPYIANNVIIPIGSSLTIESGTVIKVPRTAWAFSVYGALTIGAPDAEQVIVTSLADDTIGGDTNADGSRTVPWPTGDWYGINVVSGTTNIVNAALYYGGYNVYATVYNQGGRVSVSRSEFFYSNHSFILLDNSTTEIYENTIRNNDEYALWQKGGVLRFGENVFASNTLAILLSGGVFQNDGNNSGGSGIYLRNRTLSGTTTFSKDGLPYVINNITVPVGASLVIEPGAIVKAANTNWALYTYGTLTIGAPDAEQVIITSLADDTVGGDTNNNGAATMPAKGDWCSINTAAGVATIINTAIRYGGCPSLGQITNYGADVTIANSKFSDSSQYNIRNVSGSLTLTASELTTAEHGLGFHGGSVVMHDNSIHNNIGYGVYNSSPARTVIDATNNWWGDASGPRHPSNPLGIGDVVTNYVNFVPWLGSDPLEKFELCAENCYSNVLFLPGLEASRLYVRNGNDENQLWEPNREADAEKLFLDENGKSIRDDVYTRDVINEKNVLPIAQGNIYKSFIAEMNTMRDTNHLINDWQAAPYDWRLTLDDILEGGKKDGDTLSYLKPTTEPYIISELERLASTSKSGKVTIVAHSNGGLVAKTLIRKLGDAEAARLIDKVVLVAVPQSGTPQAIGALLHGYNQGLPYDWLSPILSPKMARTLVHNMPSAYPLLPSDAYFSGEGSGVDTPPITFRSGALTDGFIGEYGEEIGDATELKDFLLNTNGKILADSSDVNTPSTVNPTLLTDGADTHQALDDMTIPETIGVYQIAGFGEETLGTIRYWTDRYCIVAANDGRCIQYESKLRYTPESMIDGDGTVVTSSALSMSTSVPNVKRYWVDLGDYNIPLVRNIEHANILEVDRLRDLIKDNIITRSSATLPNFISDSEPPTNSEKRLRFYLHSPLALSIQDSAGHEVSATASDIPGARYRRFGEVQYISVPAAAHPTLALDGEVAGSFTLEVQEIENNIVTGTTIFSGIPSTAETEAVMDFSDGTIEQASPLTIDYDGDGTDDHALVPVLGGVVLLEGDITPPTTTAMLVGTLSTNTWYTSDITVTLTATDNENGSGIEKTEYSLDNGTTWNTYTIPFLVTAEGTTTFQYFSTDKAGNQEEIKTQAIQIDKTAPEAKITFNPTTQKLDITGTDNLGGTVTITTVEFVSLTSSSVIPHWMRDPESSDNDQREKEREQKQRTILTATLTDQAGHTTVLAFEKKKDKDRRIDLTLQSIAYDGMETVVPASLQYKWVYNAKKGKYQLFASSLKTTDRAIESHYRPKQDVTIIMEKPQGMDDRDEDIDAERRRVKEKLPGMAVPYVETVRGMVNVKY